MITLGCSEVQIDWRSSKVGHLVAVQVQALVNNNKNSPMERGLLKTLLVLILHNKNVFNYVFLSGYLVNHLLNKVHSKQTPLNSWAPRGGLLLPPIHKSIHIIRLSACPSVSLVNNTLFYSQRKEPSSYGATAFWEKAPTYRSPPPPS